MNIYQSRHKSEAAGLRAMSEEQPTKQTAVSARGMAGGLGLRQALAPTYPRLVLPDNTIMYQLSIQR